MMENRVGCAPLAVVQAAKEKLKAKMLIEARQVKPDSVRKRKRTQ